MIGTDSKKQGILKAYQFRHACKVFDTKKKISDEDFHFILETGRLSPSSVGLEPWKFVVIQDEALREKLKSVSGGAQGQLPTASHFVIILARSKEGLRHDSAHVIKMMKDIHHMPEEVVQNLSGFYKSFVETELEDNDRLVFEWASKQTYIALGNMMTAAAQIGIDSCPIEGFDKKQVNAILQNEGIIDGNDFGVACMVAFGYRKEDPKRPKTRQNLDEIVAWR
ncbi:NAD(P)H-dependent oxidoreductase (plasmid) [Bacillus mycoides]|uniref:NAD(P)H-dependent oxidoreductase n=1 Tax=Bacillus mycoides TaxID=1405 RepID=UPI001C0171AB|nr:NAD(P)H-dependent oxidoreductase [Bacillus mycoides]NUC20260.1 NAD(P)H-dependent oxidoreductase [Bacillus mycoides]QWG53656.1 NAD(P)H-dependent oxidoreductase [Bacillus mycoides]QWG75754.1 NAD(P)H-dependent oxidoreductase [Bacillus mycoides]QWH26138.1 NAD(P)H-dependent oxidoreductase [Bacillus mycoides]QWH37463.1 NAD(P)H-dependent oxidoreductase [Bacillus mycoides]